MDKMKKKKTKQHIGTNYTHPHAQHRGAAVLNTSERVPVPKKKSLVVTGKKSFPPLRCKRFRQRLSR